MPPQDGIIAIIGLGYVGLPLAIAFGKRRKVIGFDLNQSRIGDLDKAIDRTLEVGPEEFAEATGLSFTTSATDLRQCAIFIVTVPTPIDKANQPDLAPLVAASEMVGRTMSKGALVIFESTVYPGCTREICVPILERESGLRFNEEFYVGYSPERINPGDRTHRLATITKVTSGSTPEAARLVDHLYSSIVEAGTFTASSIEVAEAAKVIENTQRDLNIALMNELAIIFNRLHIDTAEVLAAARTKWNFLPFAPGLVGGHCIGIDPYYLTHRAQQVGYHPEVILAGRRINDSMGEYVANRVAELMMKRGIPVVGSNVLVLGVAFKENCPDLRNSRVIQIIRKLTEYNASVDIYDPWVRPQEAVREYGIQLTQELAHGRYDAVILAVGHRQFVDMGPGAIRALARPEAIVFDVKSVFEKDASEGRL